MTCVCDLNWKSGLYRFNLVEMSHRPMNGSCQEREMWAQTQRMRLRDDGGRSAATKRVPRENHQPPKARRGMKEPPLESSRGTWAPLLKEYRDVCSPYLPNLSKESNSVTERELLRVQNATTPRSPDTRHPALWIYPVCGPISCILHRCGRD